VDVVYCLLWLILYILNLGIEIGTRWKVRVVCESVSLTKFFYDTIMLNFQKNVNKLVDIELSRDFTLKPLFSADFGLKNLDLLETLGTGTFGRVRCVRNIADKKYYALKMMKKSRIVKYKQLDHIQNEVRILSRIRCGFVVNLHAVFQDDNSLYMMLDYIPGGELFSYIRKMERLEPILYQFYACELVCALHYLHSLNIAYRDTKPENILIDRNGHIRLVDFGFAKIIDDRTYTLCGTPEYLAPEVIQGNGHGLAIDWWALVSLFVMGCW
jgi:serine/threonine protein kinase